MKPDLEVIYSDRCAQLARHVSAAMTLSGVSPVEAMEMALVAAQKWFAQKPDADGRSGRLMLAGLAIVLAAVDHRLLRRSQATLVRSVRNALAAFDAPPAGRRRAKRKRR
ncbi:MAG: hypothetical protein ACREIP_00100 [Alphaproteobacteria bacterium]